MATIYCDSAGSNTSPYDTWAKAATAFQTALTAWSSGDVILIKYNTTVAGPATATLTGGASATPIPVYTADASDVYTIGASGNANIDISNAGQDLNLNISGLQWNGLYVKINDDFTIGNSLTQYIANTTFNFGSTDAKLNLSSTSGDCRHEWENVHVTQYAGTYISIIVSGELEFIWNGGSYDTGLKSSGLFQLSTNAYKNIFVTGVDFSDAIFSTYPLVDTSSAGDSMYLARFINCQFPASINFTDGTFENDNQAVELISCDSGHELFTYKKFTYRGSVQSDKTTYLTAGFVSPDGDTPISHAINPSSVLQDGALIKGPMLVKYVDIDSAPDTATITIHSADDFTNAPNQNQAYLEVFHLNSASEVLWDIGTSQPADLLATTALASGDSWTGSPGHTHKMIAAVTLNQSGYIGVRVVLGNMDLSGETANDFFYDPEINVVLS